MTADPAVISSRTRPPRVVLHIGMHKTGSSSLQRFLSRNRPVLRLLGIDYPPATGERGQKMPKHNDYFLSISHEKDRHAPHPALGPSADRIQRLCSSLKPGRTTILSAEGLSGANPAFARAFQPLAQVADVRVICFLRRQDDWAMSFYKQMVLSREVRMDIGIRDFLALRRTRRHLDYATILGWWSDAFGRENIRVLTYPPQQSVIADLMTAAGLPLLLRRLPFAHSWENKGQASGYIERVRQANEAQQDLPPPSPLDPDHPLLTRNDRQQLMASHKEGNEWIRRHFRPDLPSLFSD